MLIHQVTVLCGIPNDARLFFFFFFFVFFFVSSLSPNQMSEEATFKERQLESSQATMARLLAEKEQRAAEVEKIASLDEKIKMELSTLAQKMASMTAEMGSFDNLEALREGAQASKAYLHQQIESYKERTRMSKDQVSGLRRSYEEVKSELAGNETYQRMEQAEGRLRKYAQQIFVLQEYVETKGRETDYEGLKDGCLGMATQLNALVKEQMTHQATNLSDAPISYPAQQY